MKSGKGVVGDEAAEVMPVVERVVRDSLREIDEAVARSARNLEEADELYDEAEGDDYCFVR
jgi:hypothetical protein